MYFMLFEEEQMKKTRLYSCKEACEVVEGLTEYMFRKLVSDGTLASVRLGRNIMVPEESLFRLVYGDENNTTRTTSESETDEKTFLGYKMF